MPPRLDDNISDRYRRQRELFHHWSLAGSSAYLGCCRSCAIYQYSDKRRSWWQLNLSLQTMRICPIHNEPLARIKLDTAMKNSGILPHEIHVSNFTTNKFSNFESCLSLITNELFTAKRRYDPYLIALAGLEFLRSTNPRLESSDIKKQAVLIVGAQIEGLATSMRIDSTKILETLRLQYYGRPTLIPPTVALFSIAAIFQSTSTLNSELGKLLVDTEMENGLVKKAGPHLVSAIRRYSWQATRGT